MKIIVIIVTYNAMPWVERCFNSLQLSSLQPDVYVVDNGSTDGTQVFVQSHYPDVVFQQCKENLGFGKANNLGLQYALDHNYDYVYLLNQDAWVFPDTFERLVEISMRNSEYGILSPFQMEANMEHLDRNFKKNVCKWQSSPELLDDIYFQKQKEVIPVTSVMAAHWLITRKCLHTVGGFSPTFPHYGEDDNYIHRASLWGFCIGVVPQLNVVHDRENREKSKKKAIYMCYISHLKEISNPKINPWKSIAYAFLTSMVSTVRLRSLVPMWDLIKVSLSLPTILRNRRISIENKCAFLH